MLIAGANILALAGATDGALFVAWVVTAVALGLAWLGRRRFAVGVSEGLFLAAVSGLLVLNYVARLAVERALLLSVVLVTLAIVWFAVAVWVERDSGVAAGSDGAVRRAVRRDLAAHGATLAGLLAASVLLSAHAFVGALTPTLVVLLGLLLAVVIGHYVWRRSALGRYAVVALLLMLCWMAVPQTWLAPRGTAISLVLLLGGVADLAVVVVVLLRDWRRRVGIGHATPQRLTEPEPRHSLTYGIAVAGAVLIGVLGLLVGPSVPTPLAVVLAAYACLTVGHMRRSDQLGETGLVLVGEAVVLAVWAWLPSSPASGLLGIALAGALMLWFARFWRQQLNDGQPWTTTGRLIPSARRLGYAAAGGELAWAAWWGLQAEPGTWPGSLAVITMLVTLLHWSMLVRDAAVQQSETGAMAAGLALLAAMIPAYQVVSACVPLTVAFWLAAAAVPLALRVGPADRHAAGGWVYNAYVGGLLPLAAAYALSLRKDWMTDRVTTALTLACLAVAVWLRWGRRRRGVVADTPEPGVDGPRVSA